MKEGFDRADGTAPLSSGTGLSQAMDTSHRGASSPSRAFPKGD